MGQVREVCESIDTFVRKHMCTPVTAPFCLCRVWMELTRAPAAASSLFSPKCLLPNVSLPPPGLQTCEYLSPSVYKTTFQLSTYQRGIQA